MDGRPGLSPEKERELRERYQSERDTLRAEAEVLRRLLWLRHGCPMNALYGDDGEMQCGKCGIDFKRMSASEIEARWQSIGSRAISEARKE